MQVVVSGQAKKTKLLLLKGDSIKWRDHFIFPVTAPLRRQLVTLLLYRAVADKSRGRLVSPMTPGTLCAVIKIDLLSS